MDAPGAPESQTDSRIRSGARSVARGRRAASVAVTTDIESPSSHTLLPPSPARRVDSLRRRADFAAVLRAGRRARRGPVAVAVRANDRGSTRVGYAVGRRVGGSVVRNRVRRRLRALVHELLTPRASSQAIDIVITAFVEAVGVPFDALRRDLTAALSAAGVECDLPEHPSKAEGA